MTESTLLHELAFTAAARTPQALALTYGNASLDYAELAGQIRELAQEEKLAVLLVEQNVRASLRIADRVYYLRHGEIILEEPAEVSAAREHWWDLF